MKLTESAERPRRPSRRDGGEGGHRGRQGRVDDEPVLVEKPPTAEVEAAAGDYLLVTERLFNMVVIRHVDEEAAKQHADRFWSCWVLFKKDGDTGSYEEVGKGGKTAALTMGKPHNSIRKYVAANFGTLDAVARRPSVAQPE